MNAAESTDLHHTQSATAAADAPCGGRLDDQVICQLIHPFGRKDSAVGSQLSLTRGCGIEGGQKVIWIERKGAVPGTVASAHLSSSCLGPCCNL